jgi:hypothetical protein
MVPAIVCQLFLKMEMAVQAVYRVQLEHSRYRVLHAQMAAATAGNSIASMLNNQQQQQQQLGPLGNVQQDIGCGAVCPCYWTTPPLAEPPCLPANATQCNPALFNTMQPCPAQPGGVNMWIIVRWHPLMCSQGGGGLWSGLNQSLQVGVGARAVCIRRQGDLWRLRCFATRGVTTKTMCACISF